ncbi:cobaltochelatase subunit CobN [Phormidesmis priestleyi]
MFASVEQILKQLQQSGYSVTPPELGTLKDRFLNHGLLHNGDFTSIQLTAKYALRVPLEKYLRWYGALLRSLRNATEKVFGLPPGNLMVDRDDILIAGIEFGNVVVAVQPSRGVHEDPSKLQHNDSLPAHHQYHAFYRWLEESDGWAADAVVHVGTHGTFEFLPGKQVALAADSTPDALLGNLPHSYIYHVVNSEGTIAKRLSYAQLVSYASPTFVPAGLYEHLSHLEDWMDEYETQKSASLPRALLILRQIIETCEKHHISLSLSTEAIANLNTAENLETVDFECYEDALETLQRYHAEHGTYPDAVGVILWGFETCKTYGETIEQILRYIGVKVDRGQGYFMKPVRLTSARVLGRLRVSMETA